MKKFSVVIFSVLLLFSCAKRGFPPGAPPDEEPPEVKAVFPSPDSVGVDPKTQIWIEFNEPMDRNSVERSISVSPKLKFNFSWGENKIFLNHSQKLLSEETYSIKVGTAAKDQSGNPIKQPYNFKFSTSKKQK